MMQQLQKTADATASTPIRATFASAAIVWTLALGTLAAGAMMFCAPSRASAYPKPNVYPISWEFKFDHSQPKRIVVNVPGSDVPKPFWYVTFTLINDTGEERNFYPNFDLVTNSGTVIHSERDVPTAVFDAIKEVERKKALEPLSKLSGKILLGEDQARQSVAIWPEPEPRLGTFNIFVGGLSGEACIMKDGKETVINDWTKESKEDREKQVMLYKTLQLTYQVRGDDHYPQEHIVVDKGSEWVMR